VICPNCGEELRFWDEKHRCPLPETEPGEIRGGKPPPGADGVVTKTVLVHWRQRGG
jgi:hypothetical protein